MAYPYEDEDRRSALVQGLLAAGLAALGTRKGQEGQGLAQAGLLGLGGYNRSLDNSSDARDRRAMREMQAQQWSMSQQEHALKLKALQDAQAQQERMGGVYSRMPTNEPTAGVAPATAAQFGPGGGDSTGMAGMPPAPVTRLPLYEQYVKQGDYFQRAAQQYPKDAEKLMALAEKAYAAAQASRDENKGDIQFVRGLDGKMVALQPRKFGNPSELPGYQPKPQWSMQDTGGAIQPVDLSGATAPAVMTKTQTFADKTSAGQLDVAQSRLAWEKERAAAGGSDKWVNDLTRGIQINSATGDSRPIMQDGKPLGTAKDSKLVDGSQRALSVLDMADEIIDKRNPTGSYVGRGIDIAQGAFGGTNQGAESVAQLQALEGALMMAQPRMEGPQSDRDVALYKQMAGKIGDPTVPNGIKKAAIKTIRELHKRYAGAAPAPSGASGGWSVQEVK